MKYDPLGEIALFGLIKNELREMGRTERNILR